MVCMQFWYSVQGVLLLKAAGIPGKEIIVSEVFNTRLPFPLYWFYDFFPILRDINHFPFSFLLLIE